MPSLSVEVDFTVSQDIPRHRRSHLKNLAVNTVQSALAFLGHKVDSCEVSVLFTDDTFIAELNQQYREVSGPTDVLSFALTDQESEVDRLEAPGVPEMLGDIVISLETAARQAESQSKTEDQEIRLLLVHGVLHLLAFDHDEPEREAVMWKRQAEILGVLDRE
jgi:probable rRNA maturation factor